MKRISRISFKMRYTLVKRKQVVHIPPSAGIVYSTGCTHCEDGRSVALIGV